MKRSLSLLLVGLALAACGSNDGAGVETLLRDRLVASNLSVKWVRCVSGFESTYRCNVDFGDPHIQIYCARVVDGKLRAAEWRMAVHGRQDRAAAARECARRLDAVR